MSRAYKCDRCGEFFVEPMKRECGAYYVFYQNPRSEPTQDFCPECLRKLQNFMENKKEKNYED